MRVRRAIPDDLLGMAHVHVDTWKTTYRGIVPDRYLDELTYESDIARGFGRWIREPTPQWTYLVAVDPANHVIGFAVGGPNRDPDPEFKGELGAIYVLKESQGRGVGRVLVREVVRHLLRIGASSMIVWVLEANPYRRFYEKLGGVSVRRRVVPVAGVPLPEVGYGWKGITQLAQSRADTAPGGLYQRPARSMGESDERA